MSDRPERLTYCLLHGKWHTSSCWGPLRHELEARGAEVVTPELPFQDPDTTWDERIAPALADAEGTVVVTHSLSGAYGALVASRVAVAGLIHIAPAPTGIFYREDAPMKATRPGFPWPSEDSRGVGAWDADSAIRAIYPRLDAETAAAMAAGLVAGAGPSDLCPIDAHPDVPTRFLLAEHDEFFNPDWERWLARTVVGVEAEEMPTGHFPMAEAPAKLAASLMRG